MSKTFEWNDLKIKVEAETARQILDRSSVIVIIMNAALDSGEIAPENDSRIIRTRSFWYARMLMSSTILEGELGFPWPDVTKATEADFYASYTGWLDKMPGNLWETWRDAIEDVNLEIDDPEG